MRKSKSKENNSLSGGSESVIEKKKRERTRKNENAKNNNNINKSVSTSDFETETESDAPIKTRRASGSNTEVSASISDDFLVNWYSTTDDETENDKDKSSEFIKNEGKIQSILAHRDNEGKVEYLVKYFGKCYKDSKWVDVKELSNVMVSHYLKRHPNFPEPPFYDPQFDEIDYIIGKKDDKYIVKWKGLDYDNITLEAEERINKISPEALKNYVKDNKLPGLEERFLPPRPEPSEWKALKDYKKSKKGLQLKPYQLEGLNFLVNSWYNRRNAILADEMGLGKTCQTSVFIDYLSSVQKIKGPYLIIVPLSTLSHWERELSDWAPSLKHITYYGIKERRRYQKAYEWFYPDTEIPKFNILITTYQYVVKDVNSFSAIKWRCVVVDEAHRLKNHESKLINCLRQFDIDYKLLLTGTPLQNNIEELWTLLNFLDPSAFESLKEFESKFGELTESQQVVQLQSILKPLMIRRRKGDVENSIIPLEEIIIECPMTQHQKAYYKSIYTRNLEYLSRGAHGSGNTSNLINISMELRKVCNHPYLIKGAENQILIELEDSLGGAIVDEYTFVNDSLIRSAGKMILLDKLLAKLKEDGHRVLIFSQMTKMLDILQDYLNFRNYKFERLDGSVRGDIRQASIDRFNEPNSEDFVFLLCTKAGGVGINLTSADTVIIYDSDWNPQNDIQATARCHRIGQTKEVKMYRLITAKSYERKMFETASIKLGLDQALLEQGKKQMKEDLDKLLKFGAYYAFEEDDNEVDKINENEDIDAILSKSTKIKHENIGNSSTFSFAQFELDESDSQIDVSAPDFWQKYLPDVKEDDISMEGISMGERRRIMREGGEIEQQQSEGKAPVDTEWNKKKLSKIMSNFMKFGWGRWHVIYDNSELNCQLSDVKDACVILLGWMIRASEEKYPVLESIYYHSRTNETKELEKVFKHFNDTKVSCSSSASKKLSRLDLLYFLNGAVGTCPNPPDGISIPDISNQKPTDWWTDKDDQLLLYGAWQRGYMNYSEIVFSNESKGESLNPSALTNRLRNLINGLKGAYIKLKEHVKDENLPFNYETLQKALSTINKRDHKVIMHYLNVFGYPDAEKFRKVAGLQNKSNETVDEYIQSIKGYCSGNAECEKMLVEKISRPDKLLNRIELFDNLRKSVENDSVSDSDVKLFHYIAENGLINLQDQDFIVKSFGTENLENEIFKYLSKVINGKTTVPKSRSTLHNYIIPDYEKNADGTPKLPIRVNNSTVITSLGTVVYDRKNFHNERYIFPAGYTAERTFTSLDQPNSKATYLAQIVVDGGDSPIFRVEMIGDKKKRVFEGNVPSKPWTEIVKAIENRKKQLHTGVSRSLTISGPEMFGFYSPLGSYLLQNLPNADKCSKFKIKKFKSESDESDNGSNEDELPTSPESNKSTKNPFTESTDEDEPSKKLKSDSNAEKKTKQKQMILSTRPIRRAAARANEKLELYFDFSEIADMSNDIELLSVVVPQNQIMQRDVLDVPVPFSKDSLKAAVKRMAKKLDDESISIDNTSEAESVI